MRLRLSWGALLFAGCSTIVTPDPLRLGGPLDGGVRVDAGLPPTDGSVTPQPRDGGRGDAGSVPDAGSRDAGAAPDAGSRDAGAVDAGATCTATDRCEGETFVSCRAGREARESCIERAAYCTPEGCRDWVCAPRTSECSEDLRSVLTCSDRGDARTPSPCELGCDPRTDTCLTLPTSCTGLAAIPLGTSVIVGLCGESNDSTHQPAPGCSATQEARAGDRTFVLTLERATEVAIELTDFDSSAAIDTIVYVRRVCDDASTQIVCDDDVPCSSSTVPGPGGCSGSVDVRQSRIRTRLEAGVYFIVADAFLYSTSGTTYRCGTVRLSVSGS